MLGLDNAEHYFDKRGGHCDDQERLTTGRILFGSNKYRPRRLWDVQLFQNQRSRSTSYRKLEYDSALNKSSLPYNVQETSISIDIGLYLEGESR